MRNVYYYTVTDANFLPRAIAMIESLKKFEHDINFGLIGVGEFSEQDMSYLRVLQVDFQSLETVLDKKLISELSTNRSYIEFLYALPSCTFNELMKSLPDYVNYVVYLDADLYFYSSVGPIFNELSLDQISIVRHNFSQRLQKAFPDSGEFNVSWVGLPRNKIGEDCAKEWSRQCRESCSSVPYYVDGNLVYGDQGYLEQWPKKYGKKLHVINHIGAGVAPWNYEKYEISEKPNFTVDQTLVIFYHFSSHQYGFVFASRVGSEYKKLAKIPIFRYKQYERHLRIVAHNLGRKKWKSRYRPLRFRAKSWLTRKLNSENFFH